jgi:hypothetical protein
MSRLYENFLCISNQLKSGVHMGINCIQQGWNWLASRCSTHTLRRRPLFCNNLPFTDLYKTHMCSVALFADIVSRIRLRSYNKCGKCRQKFIYAPMLFMDFTASNKPTKVSVKKNVYLTQNQQLHVIFVYYMPADRGASHQTVSCFHSYET